MLRPKILIGMVLSLSSGVFAELSVEERLYDLEAQVETLKAELATTKDQAMQEKANAFNPSISVVGDVVGQYGFGVEKHEHEDHDGHAHEGHGHEHEGFDNGVLLRELEFEIRAPIDHFGDGLFVVGVGVHGDHVHGHVEEANITFNSLPGLGYAPLGMSIKAGRFKTAIGRMNRVHLHNAPQVYYPQAMRAFLGDEGYGSQGLSLNMGFNPFTKSALNIFAESLFGSRLPMQDEGAQKMASGVLHLWWHQELPEDQFLDFGATGLLGRKGAEKSGVFAMIAADAHYSYLPKGFGQDPLFLLGSEFYTANKSEHGRWPVGYYSWAQMRICNATFFGLLYDLAPKKTDLYKFEHGLGAFLTHYTSEFLRLRLGYEHIMQEHSFKGEDRLMLSMIFILGSHPVEPYFINR